jgi:MFS family permease
MNAPTPAVNSAASRTWIGVFLFSLFAWTMSNLDQSLFGYAIPGILEEYAVGLDVVGLILTVGFIAAAFMVVLAGLAADAWGRRWTLAALLGTSAFFVGLHGLVDDLTQLTVLRALAFGLAAGLAPITAAYVAESAPARHRGMLMGALQCGYPLGWFLAAMLAVPLLEQSGWRAIFFIGFAVIPVAIFIGWKLPESERFTQAAATRQKSGGIDWALIRELFSNDYRRRSIGTIVLFFAFGCAYAGTAFFFPTYFMDVRGYTAAEAAQLVGLSNGIAIFGYLAAAYVGEYWMTRRDTFALWTLLGALALVGLTWIPEERWQDLALFGVTGAFFYGANAVVGALLTDLFPTRIRTTAYAVCGSAPLSLGFALFPALVPLAVQSIGWQWAFSLMIAPLLLISALAALTLPKILSGGDVDAAQP